MENYIVSARKYRPSTFDSVVGQKALTTTLKNAIQNNKLAHAYLFCGPRGVGKTSCARIFAKAINCLNPLSDGEACNECESCKAFNEQRSYNIRELDAASNNSVDDIRMLIEEVRIPPAIGKYKVFIIDEVHMLSPQAFNAFLKTLEEPPQHAVFILATTEKNKVLPTILSRCQIYDFNRISVADIVGHLQHVAENEGVSAEPEALNIIAIKAEGGMRDALSIFDQVVNFTGGKITYQSVIDNLNVLDYEYYFRLTDCMLGGNIRQALLTLNEILSKGFDGQNIISGLASHFRDLLVCKDESTLVLLEVGASIRERYRQTAIRCSDSFLFKAIELANTCDLNYRASGNKRLLLELTFIQLCQLMGAVSNEASKKKQLIEAIPASEAPLAAKVEVKQPVPAVKVPTAEPQSKPTEKIPELSSPFGVSIKGVAKKDEKQSVQEAANKISLNDSYTEEDICTQWKAFAETLDSQVLLKNTMIMSTPHLLGDNLFEVKVTNPSQVDDLSANSFDLLQFIRKNLNNSHIQMRVVIDKSLQEEVLVSNQQKYEHLADQNPLLNKLVNELDLKFD